MKHLHQIAKYLILAVFTLLPVLSATAQDCGPDVPVFEIDMSNDPNAVWLSPFVVRNGNCCGTTNPDRCVAFIITLHPDAEGIIFDVCDGAVSPGAMFYQVNCGPEVQVGQSLCLDGTGPHYLTFCKPGNNENVYCITSVSEPGVSPDQVVGDGCTSTLSVWGFDPSTIQWNSVSPGAPGQYNSYLNCTNCESAVASAVVSEQITVTYEICGMPVGGCEIIQSCVQAQVTFVPGLSADVNPNPPIVCYGEQTVEVEAVITGGLPPFEFTWSNGETGPITNLPAGPAFVTVNDATTCPPVIFNFVVAEYTNPPSANAGPDVFICSGDQTVDVSGSYQFATGAEWIGGEGYFLLDNQTLNNVYVPTLSEIANGFSLTLQTFSEYGCPGASDEINVSLGFVGTTITDDVNDVSCTGFTDGSIGIAVEGLTGPYSYSWSNAGQTATIDNLSAGFYDVLITDAIGCDTSMTFYVSEPNPLQIDILSTQSVSCFGGEDGSLEIQAMGGTPPLNASLYNTQLQYQGFSVDGIAPGSYEVVVTDVNGCVVTETIEFEQPEPLELSLSEGGVICPGESLMLEAQATGGTGQINYFWNQALGDADSHELSPPVTTSYAVFAMDEEGCSSPQLEATIEVMVLTTSGLSMSTSGGICPGDVAELSAQFSGNYGPYSFQWSNGLGTQPGNFFVNPPVDTWYSFTVNDVCGNNIIDSVWVEVYDVPEIELPGNIAQGCIPFEVDFAEYVDNLPGMSYNWNFGDGYFSFAEDPVHEYDAPGIFNASVLITTPDGCILESSGNGTISAFANPTVEIETDYFTTTLEEPQFTLIAVSNDEVDEFRWFETTSEYSVGQVLELTYTDTGNYTIQLIAINEYGCTGSDYITLEVIPVHELIVPNVFTPNPNYQEDGYYSPGSLSNNIFYPFTEYVKDFELLIFNRWGEIVFESNDLRYGWNGYYRGELCQQDVYVYKLRVEYTDGQVETRLGDITLLR